MGSQLIKGYSIDGQALDTVGLSRSWKLYKGKKQQTHSLASIFLIEKKQIKKGDKQQTIKMAKKQASQLLRVRHPGVLAVLEALTQDDNILGFVTQRVQGSIAHLALKNKLSQFIASQLQLKLYFYPFMQTVGFIHDSLKQVHLALSPQNIFILPDGKWKLGGFGMNQQLTGQGQHRTQDKIYNYSYAAPQLALGQNYTRKSDMFSVGLLLVQLLQYLNKNQAPLPSLADKSAYQKNMSNMQRVMLHPVIDKSKNPNQLKQLLRGLLNWQQSGRIGVSDVLNSRWMNDSTLITVKYLDKISSYQNKQQLQFLKGLAGVLQDFEQRVVTRIILPKLMDLLKFGHLIASIVYITVDLLKKQSISKETFVKVVWPAIRAVLTGKQMTAHAIFIIVSNLQILQKWVGQPQTTNHLIPLYIKCFDCPPKLKHLALSKLQRIAKKIDYQLFKTKVMPKMLGLLKDPQIQIRKDALKALLAVVNLIDSQNLSFSVLPALQACRKAGSDPFVNAIINKIYNLLALSLPVDVIANKILPNLVPYLGDPSISYYEFVQFRQTINHMIERMEGEKKGSGGVAEGVVIAQGQFLFKEEEKSKPAQSKGNYNFLSNYIEASKPIQTPAVTQQQNMNQMNVNQAKVPASISPSSQDNTFNFNSNPLASASIPDDFGLTPNPKFAFNSNPTFAFNAGSAPTSMPPQPKPTQDQTFNFGNTPTYNLDFTSSTATNYQPISFDFPQTKPIPPVQSPKPPKTVKLPPPAIKKQPSQQVKKEPAVRDQPRFVGGASGPMEIKKLVGPAKPKAQQVKKQATNTSSFDFDYLSSSKAQSNISMDFGGFGGMSFNTQVQPNTSAKVETMPQMGMNMGLGSLGSSADNPFQDIESQIKTNFLQVSQQMKNMAPKPAIVKPKAQSNDIYSYFQEQMPQQDKPKPSSFDLI